MQSILKQNNHKIKLGANLLGRFVNGVIPLIFIPLFFKNLGSEVFGVFSYILAIQGILCFFDLGLSSTLGREFAKDYSSKNKQDILHTYEIIHFAIGIAIIIILFILTNLFFNPINSVSESININFNNLIYSSLFYLICFWPTFSYAQCLIGSEMIVQLNIVHTFSNIFKYCIGFFLLLNLNFSLDGLLIYQGIISILTFSMYRLLLVNNLTNSNSYKGRFNYKLISERLEYSTTVFKYQIIAGVNKNSAKLIIPLIIGIKYYAFYSLAYTLSSSTVTIVHPVLQTYFPRIVRLLETNNLVGLRKRIKECLSIISFLIFAPSSIAIFAPSVILSQWIGMGEAAIYASNILPFLMLSAHLESFSLVLELIHKAIKKPIYIVYSNFTNLTIMLCGFIIAFHYKSISIVITTLILAILSNNLILLLNLKKVNPKLNYNLFREPGLIILFVYLSILIAILFIHYHKFTLNIPIAILYSLIITIFSFLIYIFQRKSFKLY